MGKLLGVLLAIVLLAGAAAAGGWLWLNGAYAAGGPATEDGKPRLVIVDRGAGTQAIATRLKEAGAIADADQFRLIMRLREFLGHKPTLKAGEYVIPSGASMEAIVDELSAGASLQYAVVIPEGLSSHQILRLLTEEEWNPTDPGWRPAEEEIAKQRAAYNALPEEQRQKPFRAKWRMTYKLAGEAPEGLPEGSLLPGDYAVSRGDTVASVIKRMQDAQQALLNDLWDKRDPDIPVKTREEAIILASVVEKETGNADEQPTVAGLYSNRLRAGMRLQADATVVYGVTKGKPIGRKISRADLDTRTPWNTYAIDGLPETPICNPGASAIRAVLNPEKTKAFYMMADGQGGHHFSETYAEHQKRVDAYWKLRGANEAAGVNTPAVRPR
ncbi:MAG: endolytic transglycosylase MltG [Hyphomonadaceae bacterium]